VLAHYDINHLKTGRILYALLDGVTQKPLLDFRDFETGSNYLVALRQVTSGEGKKVAAAFYIDLTMKTASGGVKTYVIGRPGMSRTGVIGYRVRQIILSPDETSLVFFVEKDEAAADGSVNIRYMVETVRLK
jgi:predicted secreted protein